MGESPSSVRMADKVIVDARGRKEFARFRVVGVFVLSSCSFDDDGIAVIVLLKAPKVRVGEAVAERLEGGSSAAVMKEGKGNIQAATGKGEEGIEVKRLPVERLTREKGERGREPSQLSGAPASSMPTTPPLTDRADWLLTLEARREAAREEPRRRNHFRRGKVSF